MDPLQSGSAFVPSLAARAAAPVRGNRRAVVDADCDCASRAGRSSRHRSRSPSLRRAARSARSTSRRRSTRSTASVIHDGQPQVNLSETLSRIPGVFAANRQNYAQDLQISSRGFGARAAFGVRGVRLYQDGIPVTMPDGQGQTGSFSLFSAQRIEVLRGPFSALYGNASGGVISVFTEDPSESPLLSLSGGGGSYGTGTLGVKFSGTAQRVGCGRRGERIRHRRLSRALVGAARPDQREARVECHAGNAHHADRQHAVPAGNPGSARPHARAMGGESARRRSRCDPVRHAQDDQPGARRCGARSSVQRRPAVARRCLRRSAADPAIPGILRRRADVVGRRDRPRSRFRRRRRADRLARRRNGPPDRRHVRRGCRPSARDAHGVRQQQRSARRPAARRGRYGAKLRRLRPGRMAAVGRSGP